MGIFKLTLEVKQLDCMAGFYRFNPVCSDKLAFYALAVRMGENWLATGCMVRTVQTGRGLDRGTGVSRIQIRSANIVS